MATDPVSRVENRVRMRLNRGLDVVMRNVRGKYFRPIFSEKVPDEVLEAEFDLMRPHPDVMAQYLQDSKMEASHALDYLEEFGKRRAK